jgi:hypothetical protein
MLKIADGMHCGLELVSLSSVSQLICRPFRYCFLILHIVTTQSAIGTYIRCEI